jgi:predicted secreted Zn-dependent protease
MLEAGGSPRCGGRRIAPYGFSEQAVAMYYSVLSSPVAIAVNIEIMRIFVGVRALAATHGDLAKRLAELEEKAEALALNHDIFSRSTRKQRKEIFDALREPMTPPDPPNRPIGFVTPEDQGKRTAGGRRQNLIRCFGQVLTLRRRHASNVRQMAS